MKPAGAEDELNGALQAITPARAFSAARFISAGDEDFLMPSEAEPLGSAVLSVRRASGAARFLARNLMARLGVTASVIARLENRAPVWPAGIIGALAHDAHAAVAMVAARRHFGGLGIDVEPAETIEGSLVPRIADGRELEMFECEPYGAKMLFSIKEAVFKAVHPQDGVMLDFPDIRIDRKSQTARTAYGRVVEWRVVSTPRVVATAWWL